MESKEGNDAVFSQAVQLKLKQKRIRDHKFQTKLPCLTIHVIATEDEAQLIHTNIEKTPTEMKSSNYETNASGKHESSAKMLKSVLSLCVEESRTFKHLIHLMNPMEETDGCNSVNHLKVPEDEVTIGRSMMMNKQISKVETREEAMRPSILLLLHK